MKHDFNDKNESEKQVFRRRNASVEYKPKELDAIKRLINSIEFEFDIQKIKEKLEEDSSFCCNN